MFFWTSLAFSVIQRMLAIWSLVPLPYLNPACTSRSSRFMFYWSLAWRILNITLLACETSTVAEYILWHCFSLGLEQKLDLFQSCGHCWISQICWRVECSIFIASSFRIWNSSAGISSPPLALFVMMVPKAHLTSHSRMSGSRWVITNQLTEHLCAALGLVVGTGHAEGTSSWLSWGLWKCCYLGQSREISQWRNYLKDGNFTRQRWGEHFQTEETICVKASSIKAL